MSYFNLPSIYIGGNSEYLNLLTSPLNKAWRARILLNRKTSNMAQSDQLKNPGPIPNPKTKNTATTGRARLNREREMEREAFAREITPSIIQKTEIPTITNDIIIINPNSSPPMSIKIQGRPEILSVDPDTSWATIKPIGRNNPFYMYTGAEDTISFDISWYSIQEDRQDVITKCRLLESWSKSNGYISAPSTLFISWGQSDLFKDDTFILWSAKYKLSNFQNAVRISDRRDSTQEIRNLEYYPNTATQELIFKRVSTDNRTTDQIVSLSKAMVTDGITVSQLDSDGQSI